MTNIWKTPEGRARMLASMATRKRPSTRSLEQRFQKFVSPEPNSGCWLWDGSYDRKGYGQIREGVRNGGKLRVATHVALELAGRPVPPGLFALHTCDVPSCVNPDHLFHGTPLMNTRDAMAKGRLKKPPLAKKGCGKLDFCYRGHPLSGENLKTYGDGLRQCRDCGRINKAARRARLIRMGLTTRGTARWNPICE